MRYEDNPDSNVEYLQTLSKNELKCYLNGYLMANRHIKEAFTGGRCQALNEALEHPDSRDAFIMIGTLDVYEALIEEKENSLFKGFPDLLEDPRKLPDSC